MWSLSPSSPNCPPVPPHALCSSAHINRFSLARSSPCSPTNFGRDPSHKVAMAGRRRINSLVNTQESSSRSPSPSTRWLANSGLILPGVNGSFNDLLIAICGRHIFSLAEKNGAIAIKREETKAVRQKTDSSLPDSAINGTNQLLEPSSAAGANSTPMRRTSSMPLVGVDVNTGERLRHYNYEVKLSKLQKRALRFTWHRLHTRNGGKRVENVFEEVFDRLMKSIPMMRDMFTTRIFLSAISKPQHQQPAPGANSAADGAQSAPNPLCSSSTATLRDHARLIVKMIDIVIKNLDNDDKRRTDTGGDYDPIRLGRAHASLRPYGFVSAIWEKMGETIIDVVLGQEAVRDLPGAGQAWVVLTACLVDQLRAGFETSRELQQRQTVPVNAEACPFTHQQHQHRPSQAQKLQQEQFEAASVAAKKLLLMRSHIAQRNQQEQEENNMHSYQRQDPSPTHQGGPRYSLCNCHLAECAQDNNMIVYPQGYQQLNQQAMHQEYVQSVGSSPNYSPSGSSNTLNQLYQAHRGCCPAGITQQISRGLPPGFTLNPTNVIHLPARPCPSTPENSVRDEEAMLYRKRSGSTISSSSASRLSIGGLHRFAHAQEQMNDSVGSRRNSSAEVLLTSTLSRKGPGSTGRHSCHAGSSTNSRKSTPEHGRLQQRDMLTTSNDSTAQLEKQKSCGSRRGSQLSIGSHHPSTPTANVN